MPDAAHIPDDFPFASLREWAERLDKGTRERGAEYAAAGAARLSTVSDDLVDGVVQGAEARPHRTTLSRNARTGAWIGRCDCPVGVSCKHAVALALTLLRAAPEEPAAEQSADTGRAHASFLTRSAEALGRDLSRRESYVLQSVNDAFQAGIETPTGRRHIEAALQTLLGVERVYAFRLVGEVAESGASSPAALLAAVAGALDGIRRPAPAWCDTILEKTGAAAALSVAREAREVREWRIRLTELAAGPAAPRETGGKELRLRRVNPDTLRWEVRDGPGGAWRATTGTERETWAQVSYEAETDFAPEAVRAHECLRRFINAVSASGEINLQSGVGSNRTLPAILRARHMREHLVDAGGAPLAWSPVRLVWNFVPCPGNTAAMRPVLASEDGSPTPSGLRPLGDCLYLGTPGLFEGPRPLGGYAGAGQAPEIPTSVFADESVRRSLKTAGARVREPKSRRSVALSPCVRVTPEGRGSGIADREYAFARLCGLDAAARERLRWANRDWEIVPCDDEEGDPSAASLNDALVVFRQGPAYDGDSVMLPISPDTIDEVAAWLRRFPAGTRFDLPEELAALTRDADRADLAVDLTADPGARDWFDLRLVLRPEDTELSASEVKLLLAQQGRWVRIPGKGWRRLVASVSEGAREKLEALGIDPLAARTEPLRFHAAQLAGDRLAGLAGEATLAALRERAAALAAQPPPELPSGLNATLRPYQLDGYRFLAHLSANGLGGILADDMGLGKTLQTLAWLLWLKESHGSGGPEGTTALAAKPKRGRPRKSEAAAVSAPDATPARFRALVVAPKSVVPNWVSECAKFAPGLKVAIHGEDSAKSCESADLIVVNYVRLRLASDAFLGESWTAVVLDEGQHIKNPTSQVAETARALKATHRLVLSGTPVENRLLDLWSLYAFAMPGLLGTHASFKRNFDEKRDPKAASRLATRVRPFLLRRTKSQVATDLPERIEEDLVVELEPSQRRLYEAELKKARALLLRTGSAREFDKARFNIITSLLRLRQICCDPRLVSPKAKAADSAKLDALWELLEPLVAEGHKVLVFSQFTEALSLVSEKLADEGVQHLTLTGATENRAELVARFQNPDTERVFLLSLKAAGTGLNLTAASYVVLFDPWWNPAAEAQAIDRTHRIGQKNKVIAYRLIARDTVEEKIRALQRDKAALAGEILREESLAAVLDLDTLRDILAE